ncbi:MAG: transcription-repair coupling factor [Clostridia bacterium]
MYNSILNSQKIIQVKSMLNSGQNVQIFGFQKGEISLFSLSCLPAVLVVCDFSTAEILETALKSVGKQVMCISAIEETIFAPIKDNTQFYKMLEGITKFNNGQLDAIIILAQTLLQKMPSKQILQEHTISVKVGENYNFNTFKSCFVHNGYRRTEVCENMGEFAVFGDTVNVFPPNYNSIIQISFFGNKIESISLIGENHEKLENVVISPATIVFYDQVDCQQIANTISMDAEELKLSGQSLLRQQSILGDVKNRLIQQDNSLSMIYILPFLNYKNNILGLLNHGTLMIVESKKVYDHILNLEQSWLQSITAFVQSGNILPKHQNLFYKPDSVIMPWKNSHIEFLSVQTNVFGTAVKTVFQIIGQRKYTFDFLALEKDLNLYCKNLTVVLCCGNLENIEHMSKFLTEKNISFKLNNGINQNEAGIFLSESGFTLSASFLNCNFVVIGMTDLYKCSAQKSLNKKTVFFTPKVGDYVVHQLHGIGICKDLKRMETSGGEKDFFVIEYFGGDLLFLPSEQADKLTSYSAGESHPKLSKIGGTEFSKVKQKVKESLKKLAIDLIALYKTREMLVGHKFVFDSMQMQEFESAFEFTETPDQLLAIAEIKKDMQSKKIMDRLICGDVGYGKTEVAFRAIYMAILDGKQACLLCPTSVLSQQHYFAAKKRFKDFGIEIGVINRLRKKIEIEQTLKKLADGKLDLIIGTHRLLSKDVIFKNLGLLVLDEEQRFGVGDKEKIKNIKKDIDVLTLSATPIPRTLHMALSNIRQISVIETPPVQRLPVQTVVTEYSQSLLKSVVERELDRAGQVFLIYNRVDTINKFATDVQEMFANVKICVVHGQMSETELDDKISNIYSGKFQIIIATTILENGIDLPLANTLFVVDADKFGLSTLYQLKGRIGRSNRLAYAFFTYNANKVLTQNAYERLSAISEFSSLGSGFKIAMRDLEIRGAGNVLGKEQHGHMEKVGYSLYNKLLTEAICEIKGGKNKEIKPVKIDVALPAFIPDFYITNQDEKIKAYGEISVLENLEQKDFLEKSLTKKYGILPENARWLLQIGLVKTLSENVGVLKVVINKSECLIVFESAEKIITPKVAENISLQKNCVLKLDKLPIIMFIEPLKSVSEKLQIVEKFLQNLQA